MSFLKTNEIIDVNAIDTNKAYQICKRCIMDTTDPEITFSEDGFCNHCCEVERKMKLYPHNLSSEEKNKELDRIIEKIKREGKGKDYDCIIGVSGGIDSTYVAYLVKKCGLRPLAVHLDNGWNSEISVLNIEKALKKLQIELYTYVIDWEEFKDLQVSFLKNSTPDSEIPTDHAIQAILYEIAAKNNIRYIIIGINFNTESILPKAWSYGHHDWKYIRQIHRRFGRVPLKTFPHFSYPKFFYFRIIKKITFFNILDYIDYIREDAIDMLNNELGWRYYGGKHQESIYTKFFQSYVLPTKFGYDKRKAHLSSLICSGQITREQALEEIKKDLYSPRELDAEKKYVARKFGVTENEFEKIMSLPVKSFWDYPSYERSWYYRIANAIYRMYIGTYSKI